MRGWAARRSAFYGTNSTGVRCPWRFGNLNNEGNAGLAYENGNNDPGNANWNGVPRLGVTRRSFALRCAVQSLRKLKLCETGTHAPKRGGEAACTALPGASRHHPGGLL